MVGLSGVPHESTDPQQQSLMIRCGVWVLHSRLSIRWINTGGLEGVDDGELLPAKQRGDTVGRFARHILHPLLHVPVKKKTANFLK